MLAKLNVAKDQLGIVKSQMWQKPDSKQRKAKTKRKKKPKAKSKKLQPQATKYKTA